MLRPFGSKIRDTTKLIHKIDMYRIYQKILFLPIIFNLCISQQNTRENESEDFAVRLDGDIILGGLFPVHEIGQQENPCGPVNPDRGIQRLEAMNFAVDEINNDENFFQPPLKLGVRIFDTCSQDTYAVEQSVEFVRSSLTNIPEFDEATTSCLNNSLLETLPKNVAGVIGGAYSSVSIQVANLLRLFNIPQISYASTSAQLSDKTRFDYFARTVPPDTLQARAMADILQVFNWSYVSTVASEGQYGEVGIAKFENQARAKNICIAISQTIPRQAEPSTFDDIIAELLTKPNARTIVVFARKDDSIALLAATKRAHLPKGHFIWVASDGWGVQESVVENHEAEAEGAITIELHATTIEKFDDYFLSLQPKMNTRNPWFSEYWEHTFNCVLPENLIFNESRKICDGNEKLSSIDYEQEKKVQFVVDAVYSLAYAIQKIQRKICIANSESSCQGLSSDAGSKLFSTVLNLSFTDIAGSVVEFDSETGDGMGRYDIMNFQGTNDKYKYVKIGEWINQLYLDPSDAAFSRNISNLDPAGFPHSRCSKPCAPGEIKNMQKGEMCCWICTKCLEYQYLRDEFTCEDCPNGSWPNKGLDGCYDLPLSMMDWKEPWSIIPILISSLGIIGTFLTIGLFLRHNKTPVVKASGRELSYLLLFGILLCYLQTFALLAKPSVEICCLQRFGLGLSFSICYASLLTKTNRISRIFNQVSHSARRPKYISPRSQLFICFCIICVQLIVEISWLLIEPPRAIVVIPSRLDDLVILKCGIGEIEFIVYLVYNMILILLCTIYAFKTRKIPESFNEAKFIAFTMYSTCIVWLSFVPIYFGTSHNFKIQITTMCIAVSLSASVTLCCIFFPKIYIILFQPEKNVRRLGYNSVLYQKRNSTTTTSSPCGSPMRQNNINHEKNSSNTRSNLLHPETCAIENNLEATINCDENNL